jgi:hypothetical protein
LHFSGIDIAPEETLSNNIQPMEVVPMPVAQENIDILYVPQQNTQIEGTSGTAATCVLKSCIFYGFENINKICKNIFLAQCLSHRSRQN